MSERTLQFVAEIRRRLSHARLRIAASEGLSIILIVTGIVATFFLAALIAEAALWMNPVPRSWVFWIVAGIALSGIIAGIALPLLRQTQLLPGLHDDDIARRIGDSFADVRDKLTNLLQLAEGRRSAAPDSFVDSAVMSLGSKVDNAVFKQVERFERPLRLSRLVVVPVAMVLVLLFAAPSTFLPAAQRLFSPGASFLRPSPFRFQVSPGSIELVRGDSLTIQAHVEGPIVPSEADIQIRHKAEDSIQRLVMATSEVGHFRFDQANVRDPFDYRVESDGVVSEWFTIAVRDRPLVRGLQLAIQPPSYTGLPVHTLEPNVGNVNALPGSVVQLEAGIGAEVLDDAKLQFTFGEDTPLEIGQNAATGAFTVRREDRYEIVLTSDAALTNQPRISYSISLRPDHRPTIELLSPQPISDLSDDLTTEIRVLIGDDFGISELALNYRLDVSRFGQPQESFSRLPLEGWTPAQREQEVGTLWELVSSGLDLAPGDEIVGFVEVKDNDGFSGPKAARSRAFRLRFPSLAEQYEQVEEQQDDAQDELESVLEGAESLSEQFDALRDEIRRKTNADWEDQRQLERISKTQEGLEERIEDLQRSMRDVADRMEENSLVSPETMDSFQELQRVISEINSPELQEALRQLQESLQNLDLEMMQQAMQQFEFSDEQYRQRLERTLELFKRLRTQQHLDEAARKAAEMAEAQAKLAEKTSELLRKDQEGASEEKASEDEEGRAEENSTDDSAESDSDSGSESSDENGENPQSESDSPDSQADEKSESPDPGELAREQERSAEEMQQLEELMERIAEEMENMSNTPKSDMESLLQEMQEENLQKQMQENAEQLQNGEMQKAQSGQQQMQQQLQEASESLSEMSSMMGQQQNQVNLAGLRSVLDDVLTLSHEQEALRTDLEPMSNENQAVRGLTQQQSELGEGLAIVADTLQKLSASIPQMSRAVQTETGDALLAMDRSVSQMTDRLVNEATAEQRQSMTHLNNLAFMLSELMDQLMNSASGAGSGMSLQQMLEQLQQMSGKQQQINQQIQQLLNDMVGQRLTVEQEARLEQIRSQQNALRSELQEMAQNNPSAERALGELERIAEQMEQSLDDLANDRLGRPLVERQQQILTRLLDAQRSIQERGRTRQREGRQAQQYQRNQPGQLTEPERTDQLRRDLIRAMESGYATDFQELIRRYFEALEDLQDPERTPASFDQ